MTDDTDPPETNGDGEHEHGVAEGDAGISGRVHPAEHSVAGLLIIVSDEVGEGVEVWELPGK